MGNSKGRVVVTDLNACPPSVPLGSILPPPPPRFPSHHACDCDVDFHRRNVLVDAFDVPKVADFGLSRAMHRSLGKSDGQTDYYRMTDLTTKLPIYWMA